MITTLIILVGLLWVCSMFVEKFIQWKLMIIPNTLLVAFAVWCIFLVIWALNV